MNVLFLTPDAVGGTLLQRLLTVYMQTNNFDRPVINVGHVEIGLETYHCPEFNQKILRCINDTEYNRMQSLPQVQQLLNSVDHYKLIKLPYYNILSRQDPTYDQIPFYQYLNDNFFIISCRRENVFEHALSWCLNKITQRLNVYSTQEKLQHLARFYVDPVEIDPLSLTQSLNSYKQYINWCDTHFRVASYYVYETHLPRIEDYIRGLPFFRSTEFNSWQDTFGQPIDDWNRCHFYLSDLGNMRGLDALLTDNSPTPEMLGQVIDDSIRQIEQWWHQFVAEYLKVKDPSWPDLNTMADWTSLPDVIKEECRDQHEITYYLDCILIKRSELQKDRQISKQVDPNKISNDVLHTLPMLPDVHQAFVEQQLEKYSVANQSLQRMVELGIMPKTIPVKKNTLADKKRMIKNFYQCLDVYNQWADKNEQTAHCVSESDIEQWIIREQQYWYGDATSPARLN